MVSTRVKKDVCHTIKECEEMYANLDPFMRAKAVHALRRELEKQKLLSKVKELISEYGHHEWLWHLYDKEVNNLTKDEKSRGFGLIYNPHFTFGMSIRNWLRNNGFGEVQMKVHNLDDIYINLLEDAVKF